MTAVSRRTVRLKRRLAAVGTQVGGAQVHAEAFADQSAAYDAIRAAFPALEVVEVPSDAVSLEEAIRTYLFNAQLLSLPDGSMALIVPEECRESEAVWAYCETMMASNGPIREVIPVDVRQSMANGGGPACLRLRVVCDPATVDPRFLLNEAKADEWRIRIPPKAFGNLWVATFPIHVRFNTI